MVIDHNTDLNFLMMCNKCGHKLEVARRCRQVRLKCTGCQHEYKIHEVASDLDRETEEILERYTSIIYD
jgi:DNA-directed RNA polymerase subunit M/transcription elongation factor TFIIS